MVPQSLVKAAGVSSATCLCGFGIFIAVYSTVAHRIAPTYASYRHSLSPAHGTLWPPLITEWLSPGSPD